MKRERATQDGCAARCASRAVMLTTCLALVACTNFEISRAAMSTSVQPALPPLSVRIDEESLLQALGYVEDAYDRPGAPLDQMRRPARVNYTMTVRQDDTFFSADEFLEDAKTLVRRDLPTALSGSPAAGSSRGVAEVLFTHRKVHELTWLPFVVPSVLSLCTLNLLGYPLAMQSAEVKLAIRILDARGQEIGVYAGEGSTSEFSAFYWGWGVWAPNFRAASMTVAGSRELFSLSRATVALATTTALDSAVAKIADDADRLRAVLR